MLRRAQHGTDSPVAGRQRRRTIGNWLNYRTPGNGWAPSVPGVSLAASSPDNWSGAFDFSLKSEAAALQCYFRDAADPDNRAMVGARRADQPGSWINLKALDCTAAEAVLDHGIVRWTDLWAQTDLTYQPTKDKLKAEIVCKRPGHPLVFGFTLSLAPGHTVGFGGGGARVLNPDGIEMMRFAVPWAHDSSTMHPDTLEGQKPIGVTLREGEPRTIDGRQYQVIELVMSEEDLEGAIYPVVIDPTVQITGTTDIEDTMVQSGSLTYNFGGSTTIQLGFSDTMHELVRVSPDSIPEGEIHEFRWIFYNWFSQEQGVKVFLIADANDWVEGTENNAPQTGSCCAGQAKYLVQDWAGSIMCGTPGVDYDADPDPPIIATVNYNDWNTLALKPEWAALWRDGARLANGIKVEPTVGTSARVLAYSTESGTNPLYLEIDYDVGAPPIAAMSIPRMIQ